VIPNDGQRSELTRDTSNRMQSLLGCPLWSRTRRWVLLTLPYAIVAGSAVSICFWIAVAGLWGLPIALLMIFWGSAIGLTTYVLGFPLLWLILLALAAVMPGGSTHAARMGQGGAILAAGVVVGGLEAVIAQAYWWNRHHPWPPEELPLMLGLSAALAVCAAGGGVVRESWPRPADDPASLPRPRQRRVP